MIFNVFAKLSRHLVQGLTRSVAAIDAHSRSVGDFDRGEQPPQAVIIEVLPASEFPLRRLQVILGSDRPLHERLALIDLNLQFCLRFMSRHSQDGCRGFRWAWRILLCHLRVIPWRSS